MLLNETSQKIVSLFKDIGEKVVISYPITNFKDSAQTIVVFINFERFLNEPFETFGLMKIREFLELMKIVNDEDKEINVYLENNRIYIEGEGIKCRYVTTNLDILKDVMPNPKMLENIKAAESCLDFTLSNRNIDKIKKVAQLLSLEDVVIRSDHEKKAINIGISNTSILSANNDSMTLDVEYHKIDNNHSHNVMLNVVNLKKIPCTNYSCRLLQHSKSKDNYIIHLIPQDIEGVDIVLATKAVTSAEL